MAKSEKKRRKVFGSHTPFNKPTTEQKTNAANLAAYLAKKD